VRLSLDGSEFPELGGSEFAELTTHIAQQAMNTEIVPTQPVQPTAIRR